MPTSTPVGKVSHNGWHHRRGRITPGVPLSPVESGLWSQGLACEPLGGEYPVARLPLSDGRFVEVPDQAETCNRFALSYHEQSPKIAIAFIQDDGVFAKHVASVVIPKERLAALTASFVGAAENLGVDWQAVDTKPLPPTDDPRH